MLMMRVTRKERRIIKVSKSYVTLPICPICNKETGDLLMDMRLRDKFEMHTKTPNPCEPCKKKYLTKGVLLLDPHSGNLIVIKISAFKRIFNVPVPEKHIAFVEPAVLQQLQA